MSWKASYLGAFFSVSVTGLVATGCDLGPCPDNTSPAEGSCTCSDGTQLKQSDCDTCSGSELQDFGELSDADVSGTIVSACERGFDFVVTQNAAVTLKVSRAQVGLTGSLETAAGVAIGSLTAAKNQDGTTTFNLGQGSYHFVLRSSTTTESSFRLEMHASPYREEPVPEPGNEQNQSYPVELGDELVSLPGFVGETDSQDYYTFEMQDSGTLTYALTGVSGSVSAKLYFDEPIINDKTPFDQIDATTNVNDTHELNLERGRYFMRVTPTAADSLYELRLSRVRYGRVEEGQDEPNPEPPDDWTQAEELGRIGKKLQSSIGFVGARDSGDFYRLELAQNGELTFGLRNVAGAVHAALYAEAAQIDPAKPKETLDSGAQDTTKTVPLGAGIYYLRVTCSDARRPSLYTLGLSAVVD